MQTQLSREAQVAIYFGTHRMRGIKAATATVLARYAQEWRATRRYNPGLDHAKRIARRFRLSDYYNCLLNES